ncbi:hypothetical protein PQX77_003039 [Marasmius sp. AFHP31]|nr:hypothetical protein PQX77_003039 [Marasmius sp. AFHP31]
MSEQMPPIRFSRRFLLTPSPIILQVLQPQIVGPRITEKLTDLIQRYWKTHRVALEISLWQALADSKENQNVNPVMYPADPWLLGITPFDQPVVEEGKEVEQRLFVYRDAEIHVSEEGELCVYRERHRLKL